MLDALLRLLVPPRCLACGRASPDALCGSCRAALPWLRDACPRCALPRPCAPCPAARQRFAAAYAPVAHEGPARALVHALKFRAHLAAADVMAAQMAAVLPRGAKLDAVVPVPAAPARRRRRGFDPAELLARRLAARVGAPLAACLERRAEGRQLGAPRAARLRADPVIAAGEPPPHALLVDDVHTTGATLDACANALVCAGTRKVVVVSYARTVRRA